MRGAPLRCPRPTPEIDGEGAPSHCPTTFRDPESVPEPKSIVFLVCSPAGGTTAAFDFIGKSAYPGGQLSFHPTRIPWICTGGDFARWRKANVTTVIDPKPIHWT